MLLTATQRTELEKKLIDVTKRAAVCEEMAQWLKANDFNRAAEKLSSAALLFTDIANSIRRRLNLPYENQP